MGGLQVDKAKLEKGAKTVEKETKERKERKQAKTGPKNMEDNMKKHEEARKEAANRERERKDMHGEDLRQRLHLILTKEATCLAKEEAIQAEVKKQQEAREAEREQEDKEKQDQEKKEKYKQDQEKKEKQDKGTKEKDKQDKKDKRDKKVKNARGKIASANVLGLQVDKAKLEKGAKTVEKETKERRERLRGICRRQSGSR